MKSVATENCFESVGLILRGDSFSFAFLRMHQRPFKGELLPKSIFFLHQTTFPKEESGINRRACSEQQRAKQDPQDRSHSRTGQDTPTSVSVTSLTQLAHVVAREAFLFLYSKACRSKRVT